MGSKIEWTDVTWNPVTGCTPISDGCKNCYAAKMHRRLHAMKHWKYENDFRKVTMHWDAFEEFYCMADRWKKFRKVFVCSMSDLFHPDVTDQFIKQVLTLAELYPQHTFQLLTKRAARLPDFKYPENVWLGVTVENSKPLILFRLYHLFKTNAKVKFISFEPLLDSIFSNRHNDIFLDSWMEEDFYVKKINWIIAGGETGPKSRPVLYSWGKEILDFCQSHNIPFFFKQWNKKGVRHLEGKEWNQFPNEK